MPAVGKHRYGHQWRNIRRAVLDRDNWQCQLCGQPIDPQARPRTPQSASVDHVQPLKHGGNLLDLTNLRAAHLSCNAARGDNVNAPEYKPARKW